MLSLVLRHQPEKLDLELDAKGWVNVSDLLEKAAAQGVELDYPTLQQVVITNSKQRFAFSEDGQRIRANQGHSVDIDLGLKPKNPPEVLYHGTADKSLKAIRKNGLQSMKRQHVHLSNDVATAEMVGSRHGKPIVLTIRSGEMARRKHLFYLSENGVWLTEEVPAEFIVFP